MKDVGAGEPGALAPQVYLLDDDELVLYSLDIELLQEALARSLGLDSTITVDREALAARLGLRAAFYWDYPPDGSPAFWAFRAFRDFDSRGARFLAHVIGARAEVVEAVFGISLLCFGFGTLQAGAVDISVLGNGGANTARWGSDGALYFLSGRSGSSHASMSSTSNFIMKFSAQSLL